MRGAGGGRPHIGGRDILEDRQHAGGGGRPHIGGRDIWGTACIWGGRPHAWGPPAYRAAYLIQGAARILGRLHTGPRPNPQPSHPALYA